MHRLWAATHFYVVDTPQFMRTLLTLREARYRSFSSVLAILWRLFLTSLYKLRKVTEGFVLGVQSDTCNQYMRILPCAWRAIGPMMAKWLLQRPK